MKVEQLSLFRVVPKEEFYSKVVQLLEKYPGCKKAVEFDAYCKLNGRINPFAVKEDIEDERFFVGAIDIAISGLTKHQRQVVEMRYFQGKSDINIQIDLDIPHDRFYKIKDKAIRRIAEALHML
jgi:DNA-directed RNA polymerase specialized sigma subunit